MSPGAQGGSREASQQRQSWGGWRAEAGRPHGGLRECWLLPSRKHCSDDPEALVRILQHACLKGTAAGPVHWWLLHETSPETDSESSHSLKGPLPATPANLVATASCESQPSLYDTTVAGWLSYLGAKPIQQGKMVFSVNDASTRAHPLPVNE